MNLHSVAVCFAALLYIFVVAIPEAGAQSTGQLRAMQQRAAKVTRMKNEFVTRVLKSYAIPYKLTPEGVVGKLKLDNKWVAVHQIEIIPLAYEENDNLKVTGHEIYFYTKDKILNLESALIVR